jgi:chemotaxis protein methyltransferase CheR
VRFNDLDFEPQVRKSYLLKKRIRENTGFNCEKYKEAHFKRRINVRLKARNLSSYRDYLKFLEENPEEYQILVRTLTTNVSEFFRDPDIFSIIEKEILPLLIKSKLEKTILNPSAKEIRIWSAGCTAGEEVYSLAILIHEILGKDIGSCRIKIIGIDIDNSSLEKTRKGIYSEETLFYPEIISL